MAETWEVLSSQRHRMLGHTADQASDAATAEEQEPTIR
jgi:hypothetical protein